jgi:hypothetical protein
MHILILDQEKMDAHLVSIPRFNAKQYAFCFPDQEWIIYIYIYIYLFIFENQFVFYSILLVMEIKEKEYQSDVEEIIEKSSIHIGSSSTILPPLEMQPQNGNKNDKTEEELYSLEIGDHFLPSRRMVDATKEVLGVHDHMHDGIGEKSDDQDQLHKLWPQIAHDDDHGMMEHMQKNERSFS